MRSRATPGSPELAAQSGGSFLHSEVAIMHLPQGLPREATFSGNKVGSEHRRVPAVAQHSEDQSRRVAWITAVLAAHTEASAGQGLVCP